MSTETTHTIHLALIGNPNSGKSTLFNSLTGLNQKTGNYPGVTVDKHIGIVKHTQDNTNYIFHITDLPGTYSLYPKSLDEEVTCKTALGIGDTVPDVMVVVTDASNLKRHLLLTTQVLDLKLPTVVVLNMADEAEKLAIDIQKEELQRLLGVDVVAVNSRSKQGLMELKQAITKATKSQASFYNASTFSKLSTVDTFSEFLKQQFFAEKESIKQFEAQDNLHRFHQINYIISRTVKQTKSTQSTLTKKLDTIFMHTVAGFIVFLAVLFLIFQLIFFIAEYPKSWIEDGFSSLMTFTQTTLPQGQLNDLLVNGILAGLSGIVVFVPQIALLFLFIAILEDSGYMARVSFIMDKLLRKFGLNGKSIIPLISGVACAVPAIMGTRTISNWKERIITILVTPLMSCSARLPVYTLLISLMMDNELVFGIFSKQGLTLMFLYLIGFVAAIGIALILKFILKAKERSYFIMELPVYRQPQWQTVAMTVFEKVKLFLWDAGKIIMAISIILWFLSTHAPSNKLEEIDRKYAQNNSQTDSLITHIESEKLEASYAGLFGKKIEPIIKPLGFDWKIGIALITSFAAREVFVGTMATIYSATDAENTESIREKLQREINTETGKPRYTYAVCWSLLIFYAFAMQCMSTLAIVYRETKTWKWPLIQLVYMTGLAYLSSFAVYQLLS